jgi:hypothetical protein
MMPYKRQKSYFISSQAFLQNCSQYNNSQAYKNIVTINLIPEGPLAMLVRRVQNRPLSKFQGYFENQQNQQNGCLLAFISLQDGSRLMDINEVPDLCSFLTSNGYRIDTNITQMFNSGNINFDNKQTLFFINY